MIISAFIVLSTAVAVPNDLSTAEIRSFCDDVPIRQDGYLLVTRDEADPSQVFVRFRRADGQGELLIHCVNLGQGPESEHAWISFTGSLYKPRVEALGSGHDGAGDMRVWDRAPSLGINWRQGSYALTVSASYNATGTREAKVWLDSHRDRDRALVEGVARAVMSGLQGKNSQSAASGRMDGRDIVARKGPGGRTCWSLSDWAAATGASLAVNHRTGLAQVVLGSSRIIVPLGADSIKVGSERVSLREPVFSSGGHWFVEAGALQGL